MSKEYVARLDLDLLYPEFLLRLLTLLATAAVEGSPFFAVSGFRSWGTQHQLYANYLKGGAKAAPGGLSQHNYGLAVDVALDGDPVAPGLQPSYDVKRYEVLRSLCEKNGLVWGGKFGDAPHIGWPNYENASQLRPLLLLYTQTQGGQVAQLKKVWQYLDEQKGVKNGPVIS